MIGTETVREIHSRDEPSLRCRTADMGYVGIFIMLTQGANDAAMEGNLGGEICQMQMP